MRNKVAKRLRKVTLRGRAKFAKEYGSQNHNKEKKLKDKEGKEQIYIYNVVTIVCLGARQEYQDAKKDYKRDKKGKK